jgi:hypothetical protein
MESAKLVSLSAIPLELINIPAIIKKGIESNVRELSALNPTVIRKEKSGNATIPIYRAAAIKQKGTGTPTTIVNIKITISIIICIIFYPPRLLRLHFLHFFIQLDH